MTETTLPTPEELRKLLRYEPETGKLFWLHRSKDIHPRDRGRRVFNTRFAGKEAFTACDPTGYKRGKIFDRLYHAHRVIWALVHGSWPEDQIDHINGVRDDNRLVNLRSVTGSGNSRNAARASNNTSGVTGVYWFKNVGKWAAQIKMDGRSKHLGVFDCFEDAVAARKAAEVEYGFHPNHGR